MLWGAGESQSGFLRRRLVGGGSGVVLLSSPACFVARRSVWWACFGVSSRISISRASHCGVHSLRRFVGRRFGTVWLPVRSEWVLEAPISEPTGGTTLVPRYNNPG